MNISGVKNISIWCTYAVNGIPANTVLQFNSISQDSKYEWKPLSEDTASGGVLYAGEEYSLDFTALDPDLLTTFTLNSKTVSKLSTLQTWQQNGAQLRAVVYGLEDNILWYEDSYFTFARTYNIKTGTRDGVHITLSEKGIGLNIASGMNLFDVVQKWSQQSIVS